MQTNLLESLPIPACLLDADLHHYLAVNEPFWQCLGYAAPQDLSVLPTLFAEQVVEYKNPAPDSWELELTTGDRSKKYLSLSKKQITIVDQSYWLVTIQDITKYKQETSGQQAHIQELESQLLECSTTLQVFNELLESQVDERHKSNTRLRRNRQFMQRFIASSPCILYIYDLMQMQYVYINQESIKRLGYDPLSAITIDQLLHPEDIEKLTSHYQKCSHLSSTQTLVVEYRLRRADQTFCWYRSYDAVFEMVDDRPVQIVGVAIDITEQKFAELALAHSEQKNRAILGAIPDLMLRLRSDGTCLQYLPPPQPHNYLLIKDHLKEVLDPPALTKHLQAISQALANKKLQICEQQVIKNSKVCDEEVYIVAISDDEVLEIVRDISDRKAAVRTQLELTKQKEMMELQRRFFAMLSHEFRTPLATILASAQLLQTSHQQWLDAKAKRNLRRIETSVQDALEVLENIITIGQADAGTLQVKKQTVNLRSFTEEVVDSLVSDRVIIRNYPCSVPQNDGSVDPFLLRRVLVNLLNNAIKYSPEDMPIEISLLISLPQHQAIWQVSDQGIGIAEADQEHIFRAGWRGSNTGQARGSGLGLAVVKACVSAMGGVIMLNSQLGKGSYFALIVPIATP